MLRRVPLILVIAATAMAATATPASAKSCRDVVITKNSGDGMFNVKAKHLSCRVARRTLKEWGSAGYKPRSGPAGYDCKVVKRYPEGNSRVRCTAGRKVISWDTGF